MEPRAGARGENGCDFLRAATAIVLQWSLAPEREERNRDMARGYGRWLLQWSLAPEREERNFRDAQHGHSLKTSMEPRAGARGEVTTADIRAEEARKLQWSLAPEREESVWYR